jgi:CBS domain-containing protein
MRPITAADLMSPEVLTVPEEMTVRELAGFLMDHEITGAPVVDAEGRLTGVVSVVDIADMAAGEEEDDEAASSAGGPEEEGRIGFFARAFRDVLSTGERKELDLFSGDEGEVRVGEIMNPEVYSVPEDATVSEVASTLLNHHVHRVVVIEEGRVQGIITTSDLLGLLVDET